MTIRYGITIDNGVDYSADLLERFNTEEDAESYGKTWLDQFYVDNGIVDAENCGAGFDVFKEEVPDEEEAEQYDPKRDGWVDGRGRP